MVILETPSRVLRRINAAEGADMPSLPSLPGFDDSDEEESDISRNLHFNHTQSTHPHHLSTVYSEPEESEGDVKLDLPVHSTPSAGSSASAIRGPAYNNQQPPSSTASAVRFASSIASRSRSGSNGPTMGNLSKATSASAAKPRAETYDSFDVSGIPSLPDMNASKFSGHSDQSAIEDSEEDGFEDEDERKGASLRRSKDSVPDVYLPPEDDDPEFSLTDALESVSRASSPFIEEEQFGSIHGSDATPRKKYDYTEALRPEPEPSPFDKFRNVAMRKSSTQRYARPTARTPSLTRTTASPSSSTSSISLPSPRTKFISPLPSNSPRFRSPAGVPLPRSATASPSVPSVVIHRPEEVDALNMSLLEEELGPLDGREDSEGGYSLHQGSESEPPYDFNQGLEEEEDEQYRSQSQDGDGSQNGNGSRESATRATRNQEQESRELSSREPTFSSSVGAAPSPRHLDPNNEVLDHSTARPAARSRSPSRSLSPAPSSPAPSLAYTPTPANPPRARARPRYSIASLAPDFVGADGGAEEEDEEPATPHTRRRSFLMDVINSSARPRMKVKFPTPHPAKFEAELEDEDTPQEEEEEENQDQETETEMEAEAPVEAGSRVAFAFAGATPKSGIMRGAGRRGSHPLAQTYIPPSPSDTANSRSRPGSVSPAATSGLHLSSLQTPTPFTPALASPSNANNSFVSTASSHDLTTHNYMRANASFDPVMGLGDRGGAGVGRFNAGKLNAYLHGLNRRLVEENEGLVIRVQHMEQELGNGGGRRLSGGRKGRSSAGSALGDVEENVVEEGWMDEKKELEEMVDVLTEEINRCNEARGEVDRALEEAKEERTRDKDRWKERMSEVEQGVEGIVKELEQKVENLEKRVSETELDKSTMERALDTVEEERDSALQRAEKAEKVLGDGRELGAELKQANDRVAQVLGDLRSANNQIKELEDEVMRSDGRVDELEKAVEIERASAGSTEHDLQQTRNQLAALQEEMKADKEYIAQLEDDSGAAVERIENLEAQVTEADERLMSADAHAERVDQLETEAASKAEFARQMEEALESAERKMLQDEEKVNELMVRVASLEREKERERENSLRDPSRNPLEPDVDIDALESELDDANREIARLNTLLDQSPARKAIEKAKDTKIEMLERDKEDLVERMKALKNTVTDMGTPNRLANGSGMSPIHRQVLAMSMRAPRTPGAPLRDISWLNNTSVDPAAVSPLLSEIGRLQQELDLANESIDDKLDKLEDAGLGVVGLTKKLEDARAKIVVLKDEIARLSRREDRRIRRLERTRCQKCHVKVDVLHVIASAEADESSFEIATGHLPSEPPTPPTKTSDALRANLKSVNSQLDSMKKQWEQERKQLLGEQAVLQDAARRLNVQVQTAQQDAKTKNGNQGELDRAKRMIVDLEAELQAERSRLRTLTTEQNRVQRQKEDVLAQLQRTESDMDDVKKQAHRFKKENQELELELEGNMNAEQRARLLDDKVAENAGTIEQLRQERALLVTDHKELQHRFSKISERANKLRSEHASSQTAHDQRRHQLDIRMVEIDDLRKALSHQSDELQRAEEEKNRIASRKTDVAKTVAALEADLQRVRRDAEAFGRDLKHLRAEKDRWDAKHNEEATKADRARKQSHTQIRLLNEQLDGHREKLQKAKQELDNHICSSVDESHLAAVRVQHKKECKGLIVQIRYLKAKFTREYSLRSDLSYQKHYLLVLLTKFEKSEQRILTAIAREGYPAPPTKSARKPRSLKSTALSLIFILRAKRASDEWRAHSASKDAVAAALQDVRRRRAIPS